MEKFFSHAVRAGLLCIGVAAGAAAQNLVPNGNFDQQYSTPPSQRAVNVKTSVSSSYDELPEWRATNYNTPDYLATNGPTGNSGGAITTNHGSVTPYNYQAGTVNGVVGIYGSYGQTINGVNNTQRYQEYITPLNASFNFQGGKYYVVMRVLRSTDSNAATRIGLNFITANQRNDTNPPVTYDSPSGYVVQSSGVITDTQNWTLLQGTIAPSAGTYFLNIGNFGPEQPTYNTQAPVVNAYYFLDAVGVYPIPEGDKSVSACPNSQVLLGASPERIPGVSYAWTVDGSSNPPFSTAPQVGISAPASATTYVLTTSFPDGNVYTSRTTVAPPSSPPLGVYPVSSSGGCARTQTFSIYGYDPAYTYTVTNVAGDIRLQSPGPNNTVSGNFTFEATTSSSTGGSFRLVRTGGCSDTPPVNADRNVSFPDQVGGYYTCGYSPSYGNAVTLSSAQRLDITNTEGADVGVFLTNTSYQYNFTSDMPGLYLSNAQGGTSVHFILKPGQGVTITATSTNAPCTQVGRFAFYAPARSYFAASPNPAATELTVSPAEAMQPAGAPAEQAPVPFEAVLYDSFGRKVQTQRSAQGKAVFDVHELPNGLYHLRTGTGKDAVSRVIQVAH